MEISEEEWKFVLEKVSTVEILERKIIFLEEQVEELTKNCVRQNEKISQNDEKDDKMVLFGKNAWHKTCNY